MSLPPAARAAFVLVAVCAGLIAVSVQGERSRPAFQPGRYLAADGPPVWRDTPGMLSTQQSAFGSVSGPDAVLRSAATAAGSRSYRGTQLVSVSVGNQVRSVVVDVAHVADAGTLVRVRAGADGGARGALDPIVEPDFNPIDPTLGSDLDLRTLSLLDHNYVLSIQAEQDVLGRPATVVLARRRYGATSVRFWVDESTGVTLRREVLDSQGRLLRSSAFLRIDVNPPALALPPRAPATDGQPITLTGLELVRGDGWVAPSALPEGFGLFDARVIAAGTQDATGEIHLSYTDGLAAVSLFEQPGRLDTAALDGWRPATYAGHRVWALDAVPERISWSSGGVIYTLVSDTPGDVTALVGALPHGAGHPALLTRLHRGLARVGSWLNPLR